MTKTSVDFCVWGGGVEEIHAGKCVNVSVSSIVPFLRILSELQRKATSGQRRDTGVRHAADTSHGVTRCLMLIASISQLIYVMAVDDPPYLMDVCKYDFTFIFALTVCL